MDTIHGDLQKWETNLKPLASEADDLISRQAVIDAVMKLMPSLTTPDGSGQFDAEIYRMQEMFVDIWHVLNDMPSAQPEQSWIPCSERLPEEYDEYFVTWTCKESHKRHIGIFEYEISGEYDNEKKQFKGEWLLDDYMNAYIDVQVIAWQHLPEPYREENHE